MDVSRGAIYFAWAAMVVLSAGAVRGDDPAGPAAAPAVAPAAAPSPAPPAPPPSVSPSPPPASAPSFPAVMSGEVRARWYYVRNLYDRDNAHNDNLNFGNELVRLRAEGRPADDLTLRLGVYEVRNYGFGTFEGQMAVAFPPVRDDQDRPVEVDRAHLEWKPADAPEWTVTLGRQDIVLGNGFLIGDGVRLEELTHLTGYLENNRQDFDALKADWKPEGWAFTGFVSHVPDSEAVRSRRDLWLAALDAERALDSGHRPGLTVVFARDDRSQKALLGPVIGAPFPPPFTPFTSDDFNADVLAVSLRSKGPLIRPFGYSVELAREWGTSPSGTADNRIPAETVGLRAWGADARLLAFLHPERKDLARLRYVHLSGDSPGTGNTQFDPLLENQVLGAIFNAQTNVKAWDVGTSVTSVEGWAFHADYWRFRFADGYKNVLPYGLARNGRLDAGQEVDLIVSRRWSPHWNTDVLAGMFQPGDGWIRDNRNPIGFFTSKDRAWGVRMTVTFSF